MDTKSKNNNNRDDKVNCFNCEHHVITWQPQTPYACKAIGFKSRFIPSLEVFRNSGEQCKFYTPKRKR